ncbi:MAG TPA: hypothetical protein DD426_11295 [Clostridiaceae bacterium]|nr:hypothetical protein [Clostridiaceae bacterium]
MGLLELLLIGIGLSMDAFAASLCKGLNMKKPNLHNSLIIALFFGGFQAVMPLIGWLLGKQFEMYITSIDHWIAFGLLSFIGGKAIYDVFNDDGCSRNGCDRLDMKELLILSIATSIDALAVGITFAFLKISIIPAVSLIGMTTFILSLVGVGIGHRFGVKFKSRSELAGGIVLILIGLKILIEHLFFQ